MHRGTLARAGGCGYTFGLVMFASGTEWLGDAVGTWPIVIVCVAMALQPLGACLACAWAPGRCKTAAFAGVWTTCEIARGSPGLGFVWLEAGTLTLGSPLEGWLPLAGAPGAGLVLTWTAGTLGLASARQRIGRLTVGVWAGIVAIGSIPYPWTQPGGTRDIVLVQGGIAQAEKWTTAGREKAMRTYTARTREHGRPGSIVVWPESVGLASETARAMDGPWEDGVSILAGAQANLTGGAQVNLALWRAGDATTGRYYRRRLVPLAEYGSYPGWIRWIAALTGMRVGAMRPGPDTQPPIRIGGGILGVAICYEGALASEMRRSGHRPGLVANLTNDAWFTDARARRMHLDLVRVRTREIERWTVRAANTGITAFIDHMGTVRDEIGHQGPGTLRGTAQTRSGRTPWTVTGTAPAGTIALAMAVLGLVAGAPARRGGMKHGTKTA